MPQGDPGQQLAVTCTDLIQTMIRYQRDTDNIVTLNLDMDGSHNNIITHELGQAFVPVLKHLQQEKARGALRGVILTSSKKDFLESGDPSFFYESTDPAAVFQVAQQFKQFLRDLERPGVPVVAALNGDAIGAGFEVALACHHRIALDDPKIRLGLQEVKIGLMPYGGAIIRLLWLLGLEKAYPILRRGRRHSPQEALKAGLIDDLAHDRREMMDKAKAWLLGHRDQCRPWDSPQGRIPGGTAKDHDLAEKIREMAAALSAETHDNYPAQTAMLNVLSEGSKVDFDTACRIDSRHFASLACAQTSKNMIRTFYYDKKDIQRGINRPKGYGKFRPRKVGIIGSGLMGSGIAFACIRNGMSVVLKDVSKPIAERGREYVRQRLDELIQRGTFQPSERADILSRITTTEDSRDFADCDLVIEAVFENANVKQKVTREAEEHLDEYSLLGSNTISIPITRLAKGSLRPQNYVGLHFFHPADQVPLVEIVRGEQTSDETVARAFDFVNAIQKIPIVVKDDWGFYVARVQNTYLLEGITLVQEGYAPALIDNLGAQLGMSRGPLALADELGLGLSLRYEQQAAEHYGSQYVQHPAVTAIQKMVTELERPGKQRQAGFYDYDEQGKRHLWAGLGDYFPQTHSSDFDRQEISERLLFAQVIEAVWCRYEGVIRSNQAANLGSVHGWGFPACYGGVIQFVHSYGVDRFMERCQYFRKRYGQRFRPPRNFVELVGSTTSL